MPTQQDKVNAKLFSIAAVSYWKQYHTNKGDLAEARRRANITNTRLNDCADGAKVNSVLKTEENIAMARTMGVSLDVFIKEVFDRILF